MAGLNVAEWSPEQVADWLSGLGPSVAQYVGRLRARGLDGHKLLMLRCDDLEYLGVRVIGHQELVLEAVEHLRNFQYELSRECIQQLALRVSVAGTALSRALRQHTDARLETQILADVARTVHAVKPLVCWLDRWAACGGAGAGAALAARKAALLKLALEAATCAQRDRFAVAPARAVAAAAAAAAAVADYIVQEVCDPDILTPATLDAVCVRQQGKPLGFDVVPSYCGHHQLADIRFGSPAHASGAVHVGDEIVQVGGQCVIGWSGQAVRAACTRAGAGAAELALRLRRRGARPPPALAPHVTHTPSRALYLPVRIDRYRTGSIMSAEVKEEVKETKESAASSSSSSSESEPLSPPASPTQLQRDHTRMYPPKPRSAVQRRHTVCCGAGGGLGVVGVARRNNHTTHIQQFWQQLKEHRRGAGAGVVRGGAGVSPEPSDVALYARDKAVSYSTGLETGRPRTCLGLAQARSPPPPPLPAPPLPAPDEEERARGKLDKSHSTPAYDFAPQEPETEPEPESALHPAIPESPPALAPAPDPAAHADLTDNVAGAGAAPAHMNQQPSRCRQLVVHSLEKADQILQFKKCSSQIGEAMQQRRGDPAPAPVPERAVQDSGVRDESTTEKILETINIAMMQHRRRSQLALRPHPAHAEPAPAPNVSTTHAPDNRYSTSPPHALPLGVLRAVPRREPVSPLKPHRPIDAAQISVPLRHITPHDMRMLPRREPPAQASPAAAPAPAPPDIVVGAQAEPRGALSPSSAVRGIFPTSKSRSLKKKSSILAKRRCIPFYMLAARGAAGGVWQRVRARHPRAQPRWARRQLLLAHNLLYAYRTPECSKADCMIYLEGFTVCAAGEVKSRAHAFKVYHTGTAFYFACDTRDAMLAWIQLIQHATLQPSLLSHMDSSHHFSETDYSETESDNESSDRRTERDRDNKDKDKEKSKFGSLKKLTGRMQRSDSQEQVAAAAAAAATAATAASLDRKYLRFFTRNKSKDDSKHKSKPGGGGAPVPTEHYRSYRRVNSPPSPEGGGGEAAARGARRLPKPINYIHASNPNLVDFEKSDFVTKPALQPPKPRLNKVVEHAGAGAVGLVTLEQFMLQKQAEERRQLAAYSSRVLLGVQADGHKHAHAHAPRAIVADVIYGEVCAPPAPAPPHGSGKPTSVRGKDGYEKIIYPDESPSDASPPSYETPPPASAAAPPAPPALTERWRDSLRRNDKVHNARGVGGETGTAASDKPSAQTISSVSSAATHDSWNNNGSAGMTLSPTPTPAGVVAAAGPGVSRLRLMFGGRAAGASGGAARMQSSPASSPAGPPPAAPVPTPPASGGSRGHYPHLQCPPVFHAETYSLSRATRTDPLPPPPS